MSSKLIKGSRASSLALQAEMGAIPAAGTRAAELEISRLARSVWSHLDLVLACTALCAAAGYGIARFQTPVYRTSATLELLGVNSDFMNQREVQPNSSSSVTGTGESYLETQIELFSSASLVQRTLAKLGRSAFPPGEDSAGAAARQTVVKASNIIDTYSKRLRVEQVKESNLLQITFEDKDPAFAAAFVNTLISEASSQNVEDRWKSTEHLGVLFSKQVGLLRHRMEKAEQELQDYGRKSGLLYTGGTNSVAEGRLTALEQELSQAEADRIQKESRYQLVTSVDADSLPEILSNEALRSYQAKLADLRRERSELAATMTPDNPKVLKVDAQIQEVQRTIGRERQNVIKGVINDYKAASHRAALLASASSRQARQVSQQAEKAIHYDTLKREVDTTRGLYEAMLKRMNDAEVVSTVNASDIRVVDAARIPLKAAKPNKPLYTAIGLVNGLLVSLVFVFIGEYRNQTVQEPNHLASLLRVRELGVVPSGSVLRRVIQFRNGDHIQGALLAPRSEAAEIRQPRDSSRDLLKDSFRGIAASILFSHSQSSRPLALVVSSPHEAEGKTTSVFNIGVEMAATGRRILLIDGDLRRPTLHRFFGISNGRGLAALLAPENAGADPFEFIEATGIPRLSLLTAGQVNELSAGWLQADRMQLALEELREHFDLILIDSAPLLLVPESRSLAKASDGLILVFRAGKTNKDDATAACRRAAHDGTPLFGTILNDWKPSRNQNSYYARRA